MLLVDGPANSTTVDNHSSGSSHHPLEFSIISGPRSDGASSSLRRGSVSASSVSSSASSQGDGLASATCLSGSSSASSRRDGLPSTSGLSGGSASVSGRSDRPASVSGRSDRPASVSGRSDRPASVSTGLGGGSASGSRSILAPASAASVTSNTSDMVITLQANHSVGNGSGHVGTKQFVCNCGKECTRLVSYIWKVHIHF